MSDEKETYLTFPCRFPVKVIGENCDDFKTLVLNTAYHHFPLLKEEDISIKASKQGQYLAITLVVYAESQASLDALYQDLNQIEYIKMVL